MKPVRYLNVLFLGIALLLPVSHPKAQDRGDSNYICWSSDISGTKDRISYYADNRAACSQGKVTLAYERFVRIIGERPIYQIGHSIDLESDCPDNCVYLTKCLNETDDYRPYLLLIDLNILKEEFFSSYKEAWTYDTKSRKIISSSSFLVCRNNGYDDQP